MATITGHYNVTVDSRYYAFLQDDLESAEPHVLMANVEKKRELRKENKTKAKKEKRNKQIAEAIKENLKVENIVEEIIKVEAEIVESKQEIPEKTIEIQEPVVEEKPIESRYDRNSRGRGNNRRQNGGPRRGGYQRNDERTFNNDETNQQKSQDTEYGRFVPNNRGRPFRKERSEGDNSGKFGYFEDQSGGNSRGASTRRRSSGRPGGRYSRGSDRPSYERNGNDKYNSDRNGYDKNGNEVIRNDNEDSAKIDVIPQNMGTFEDMSFSRPPRSSRGRYPRSSRGGNYNRYQGQNNENDFEITKIDYFDENSDNREFRGGRGRPRGRGGVRRGRGEPWRRSNDREENRDDGSNSFKPENHDVPPPEKWPEFEEEPNPESNNNDPNLNVNLPPQTDFNDLKKSNWGEIEDDPVDSKPSEHMTLEEYRALHSKDRLFNQEGKENRKANDGQDVFSGMEEYRKGKSVEEQGDEHENHENQHGRQKQSIPVAIRFSRNTEYGGESNNFENNNTESKSFSRGGGGGGGGGGGYYRNENRFRDNSSSASGRGRSRGGSDFNNYGRGRDFNRGRGRFNRNPSYPVKRKEDQVDGININLGNEEEFPTLS